MHYTFLHGFNSNRGAQSTQKGYRYLRRIGVPATHLQYRGGKKSFLLGLIATRVLDEKETRKLAEDIIRRNVETVLVGHSNGVAMAAMIARYIGLERPEYTHLIKGIVSFNGALDADHEFTDWLPFVHNYYNPGDWIVRFLAKYRPGHIWGSFGAREYTGKYPRCTSFNLETDKNHPLTYIEPHSQVWADRYPMEYWMNCMHHEVLSEIIEQS